MRNLITAAFVSLDGVMLGDAVTGLLGLDDILGLNQNESVMILGAGGVRHMAAQQALSRQVGPKAKLSNERKGVSYGDTNRSSLWNGG
jgi:hypothetical protein